MFGKEVHRTIYLIALAGLALCLPFSLFATSTFMIALVANWVFEGRFRSKLQIFKARKSLWFILSLYLVFIAGLIFTEDFQYAFHDLRIKLPLLVIPVVIGTSRPVSGNQLRWILLSLIAGVFAGSVASSAVLFGIIDYPYNDIREISIFINHIRFSLLIDLAIFSLFYLVIGDVYHSRIWQRALYLILMLWLVVFLFLLQSVTGILIFFFAGSVLFWIRLKNIRHLILRWSLAVFFIAGLLLVISFLTRSVSRFYDVEEINPATIDKYTVNGNPYTNDFESPIIENGHYVWLYVCEEELKKEWNSISSIDYGGNDLSGQEIRYTIIRYLTSLGLRKDSAGISRLLPGDIRLIEEGKANYIYGKKYIFRSKIYEVLWQIDVFRKGANPSGHSVTQRILYLKAATGIIRDNFWTGVGTGDVPSAFSDYYEKVQSPLEDRWRLRAHNQYLTFFLTYGVFGFIWIITALICPVFLERKWTDYLMIMFVLTGFCSMLNEDTLETHIGVSFFAFFYALFLLGTGVPDSYENALWTKDS